MTRSGIFWVALLSWSVGVGLLIVLMFSSYAGEMETPTNLERAEAKQFEREFGSDPNVLAAGCWFVALALLWLVVALPLFIAAVATRKSKNAG